MISVVFVMVILVLSLSIAVPKLRQEIQRDQEAETMHRGQQYIRAIQLYYRRFRAYPTSVDALVDTNGIRFLRKRYTDPLTGKDDWKPVLLGENQAPTVMGFFGEPLGAPGAKIAGGGAAGINGSSGSTSSDNTNSNSTESQHGSSADAATTSNTQSFGNIGIMGFSPVSPRRSLLIYKTKNHYNEWEFVYDPIAEGALRGPTPAPPPSGPGTNSGSPGFNFGSTGTNPPVNSQP